MVENTKVTSPTVNTTDPTYGTSANAAWVSAAPPSPFVHWPELTTTRPVIAPPTTATQTVPVEDTSAWRTGFLVWAAAATMGALPRPDSFEKRPRAMPYRMASRIPAPRNPPTAACGENAPLTI